MNRSEAWQEGWESGYAKAIADVAVRLGSMKHRRAPNPPQRLRLTSPSASLPTVIAASEEPTRLLDIDEARDHLGGLGRTRLYGLLRNGQLESVKIGKRRFIPASAIADYIHRLSEDESA